MDTLHKKTGLPSIWSLLLVAGLAACGSDSSDGQIVAVNLSLIVDGRQAQYRSAPSKVFAWIERWFPGASPVWAQSVTDIASIQVQITGPGIPTPASTTVPVSDPTNGQEIPVTIQAPVGPNRTITVSAFNAANSKIFGGTLPGVNLTAGAPINLEIALVRLFTVTVEKAGDGNGTVTSTPPGIDCGNTCQSQFPEGTAVSLNAAAAAGSSFAGWSGDCSGTDTCTVSSQATVTARFIVPVVATHLHVDIAGTGTGTVTSQPSGISCPPSCDADFEANTTVRLTADAANGSTFSNWSGGGCSGGAPSCTVVMNANQTVTAVFTAIMQVPMSTLTVQKTGAGSGTVTSAPNGINCGTTCTAAFPTGTVVTVTATPAPGSILVGWEGPNCGGTGPCVVTLNSDMTVFPNFDLLPDLVTLSVNTSGPGEGTVTSDQGGISCPSACTASFTRGTTVVTLNATPLGNSVFAGWRGGSCEAFGTAPCSITMDDNRTANARFERFGGG